MLVHLGDVIGSEFGEGKITAITNKWIVHEIDSGKDEVALSLDDNEFWVSAELGSKASLKSEIEVDV